MAVLTAVNAIHDYLKLQEQLDQLQLELAKRKGLSVCLILIILAFLVIGLLVGLRRGFILKTIHITGFIVAFIVAYLYYDKLAPKLHLWIPFPSMGDTSSFQMLFDSVGLDTTYNAIPTLSSS